MSDNELESTLVEIDQVYELMQKLDSKDDNLRQEAQIEIDAFLKAKEINRDKTQCKTVKSRTVINKKELDEEKRKKRADQLKCLGNECFKKKEFKKAVEYYTSGILENNQCPYLFSNRAQGRIQIKVIDR